VIPGGARPYVGGGPTAPTWNGVPPLSFALDEIKSVSVTAYVDDYSSGTDVITLDVTSAALPTGLTFNGTQYVSAGSQSIGDTALVYLSISRSGGAGVRSPAMTIHVADVLRFRTVPTINFDLGDAENVDVEPYLINPLSLDVDYSQIGASLPSGVTFNAGSHQFEYDGGGAAGTTTGAQLQVDLEAAPGLTHLFLGSDPDCPNWSLSMKHVTASFCPANNRMYFHNGDYRPGGSRYPGLTLTDQSYCQEMWSLDIAARLADPTNVAAGWRFEYSYIGNGGSTVQPKHPDFCGLPWDTTRNVFWMVPGTLVAASQNAPGETSGTVSDTNFRWYEMMQFNVGTNVWSTFPAYGVGPDFGETWMSIYDPVRDRLVRSGLNGGSGGVLNIFDCAATTWLSAVGMGEWPVSHHTIRISKQYLAADMSARFVYAIDDTEHRVLRFSLDSSYAVTDMLAAPGAAWPSDNDAFLLFNSVHRVLEYFNLTESVIYTAPVDSLPLVWTQSADFGRHVRMGGYDPVNDVSVWSGGVAEDANNLITFYQHT